MNLHPQIAANQLLQGTKVSYGGTAAFNAGVGERARADARIILEGIKNSTTQTRTCIDPAETAQVKLLMRKPQQVFSCPAPGVGVGGCKSQSSHQ